ncbi:MAG: argininosuccinate lyase [Desulfobacteraceae bacterium]|jgi:argininosuccinate lyase|nr:MAG: argininosuccinate lyase [Desulfobacteraceae bacterium]
MSEKLWGGRFSENTDAAVEAFSSSIDIDKRLYHHDVEGSIAHCRMLAKCEIIGQDEAETLIRGLEQIRVEIESGGFAFLDRLEDIHMHIEHRLAEIVGSTARKLHTGRSRNDQVATDIRLWLRDMTRQLLGGLHHFRKALVDMAESHIGVIMPGYTHLQRAQPILFSHYLMAYYEMFTRDAHRFEDGLKRINILPLGSAALAGTTYPIDRDYVADLLGFIGVSGNSIDAVSDRDFIIEFLGAASICMMHFSRLSEELVLWSSSEFGFVVIPDAFSTGSSIMPQKKNPDVPELVRGKTGRVFGSLVAVLTTMKSLPLAYNRDMQEDKVPLFDAADTLCACVDIYTRMFPALKINAPVMEGAVQTGYMNATDLADYLAAKGMPFREAHGCAGEAVRYAMEKNTELHELDIDELRSFSDLIQEDIFNLLTPRAMIERRCCFGGTSTGNVLEAIKRAHEQLAEDALILIEP